jgi:hypothetical protein
MGDPWRHAMLKTIVRRIPQIDQGVKSRDDMAQRAERLAGENERLSAILNLR